MKKIYLFYTVFLTILISLINIASIVLAYSHYPYDYSIMAGACFFWVIIWFVIFLLIAIWVYKDAERRGKSGALWLIIVIILGLIGILIWLLVRPPIKRDEKKIEDDRRRCPNCGRIIPFDAKYCPYCDKKFEVK